LLIIILGLFVIGSAIVAGVALFTSHSIGANKDEIMNDLMGLGKMAYGYKLKPVPYGGGGRFYTGFIVPPQLVINENATYSFIVNPSSVMFIASSKLGYGTISAQLDSNGNMSNFSYGGDFR